MLMDRVNQWLVWLRRMKYSRGFGIQSPWAYRFVRYVINEHYPYYAYGDMHDMLQDISALSRKLSRLYFRIANYRQPDCIIDYSSPCAAYDAMMQRGCRKTFIRHYDDNTTHDEIEAHLSGKKIEMLRMSLEGSYKSFFDEVVSYAGNMCIFILEGISRSPETRLFWKQVVEDARCDVTFDLYYCGIIFFDKKMFKTNYIINF